MAVTLFTEKLDQLSADITRILDAVCYTSAERAEEVCDLLQAAINQVHQKVKWAEEVQSHRKGDPGTGLVAEIRYIPAAEVSSFILRSIGHSH